MTTTLELPLDTRAIEAILPHRAPFLLLDTVESVIAGESITGTKIVRADEPWAAGHFPGNPVFPGVLIVEVFAQLAGVLLSLSYANANAQGAPLLLAVDKAKFRRVVVPGDVLELRVSVLQHRDRTYRVRAEGRVAGALAAEAELLLSHAKGEI